MLFMEIIDVYSDNNPKHVNALFEQNQNAALFTVKAGGTTVV
jgi:hypothetical protein